MSSIWKQELHLARLCLPHEKQAIAFLCLFLSLKGWLTVENLHPSPGCLQPAPACDLRVPSLPLCIPDTPISERNFRKHQPASGPKPKNSLTKTARIALVPYQTEVTRMELLRLKWKQNFHLRLTLSRTVSLPFKSEESEAKPKQNKSTTA